MNAEQIRNLISRFERFSSTKVDDTPEFIVQIIEIWQARWMPSDFICDDANLATLLNYCWTWHHGCVNPALLSSGCRDCQELRRHVPPQPAPELPTAPATAPKEKTRDSLGHGAISVEKPISAVQSAPKESTALQDGADYAWNCRNKNNELAHARQECRNDATRTVGGVTYVDHALEQQLYEKREAEINKKYAPKSVQNIDAQVDALVAKMKREATKPRYPRY